ncbi:WS/DGAT domain-containing protein [Streptomyces sp. SID3343]|uniref:WS/DGAT domain-containing protein n=1 Tax=Streptomyces sp. SID3343 TaxID=2690260 RepID=UPI00136CCF7C|nr:WS/DGAT domain-containing protein [Streptomyces sp. SID3343]MYV99738.1 DUF1298 domain-containing protein [Streptomyces sp. SID3343]
MSRSHSSPASVPMEPGDVTFVAHERYAGSGLCAFFVLVRFRGSPPALDDVRDLVARRWGAVPRLLMYPGAGRSYAWQRRGRLDVAAHVVASPVVGLGGAGGAGVMSGTFGSFGAFGPPESFEPSGLCGPDALRAHVGGLVGEPLGADGVPWRLHLVSDYAADEFAVLLRIHHAVADGMSAMHLLTVLLGSAEAPSGGASFGPFGDPSDGPSSGPSGDPSGDPSLGSSVGPAVRNDRPARPGSALVRSVVATARAALPAGSALPFNRPPGRSRHVTWLSIPRDVVTAARAAGPADRRRTVNDVYLAAVAGALRNVLMEQGSSLSRRVAAMVPVNLRGHHEGARIGNVVGFFRIRLPLTEADPAARLARVHALTAHAKATRQAIAVRFAIGTAARLPARLASIAGNLTLSPIYSNTCCTNMPGPVVPLALAGRPVLELVAAPPLMGRHGVVFGFSGHGDTFTVSVTADAAHRRLADRLPGALADEFRALAAVGGVPGG